MKQDRRGGAVTRWRIGGWSLAAALLVAPLLAMQVSSEVRWDGADFALLALVLAAAGTGFELLFRVAQGRLVQAIAGCAILAAFLTVFADAAVGVFPS